MRHGTSSRRSRSRNNRGKGQGNNRSQVFDSNGPDVRIRGTAFQICEKYEALAKDARSSGDAILAESYMQHAEHYQRMIVMWNEQAEAQKEHKQEQKEQRNDQRNELRKEQNTYSDKPHRQKEDLSLPNSILGDEVKVSNEENSSQDKVLENA